MDPMTLPGIWSLTPLGALIGVLVLIFWLTGTGRYVPSRTVERELKSRDAAHAINLAQANLRADEWKGVADVRQKVIDVQQEQITKFADAGKTSAEFFGTVMRDGGGNRVAQTHPTRS